MFRGSFRIRYIESLRFNGTDEQSPVHCIYTSNSLGKVDTNMLLLLLLCNWADEVFAACREKTAVEQSVLFCCSKTKVCIVPCLHQKVYFEYINDCTFISDEKVGADWDHQYSLAGCHMRSSQRKRPQWMIRRPHYKAACDLSIPGGGS